MTPEQRNSLVGAVHGFAENSQEMLHCGDPVFEMELRDDYGFDRASEGRCLPWDIAVRHAKAVFASMAKDVGLTGLTKEHWLDGEEFRGVEIAAEDLVKEIESIPIKEEKMPEKQEAQGWTTETMLDLALRFIASQGLDDSWAEFQESTAAEENAESEEACDG
jgi:hypothetical protein